jgi:hypothetical protein
MRVTESRILEEDYLRRLLYWWGMMMKINRKNDYFFKRVFGHEDTRDILARFLTVVLGVPIEPDELSLIHTEMSHEYLAD